MAEWTPTFRLDELEDGPRRFEGEGPAVLVALVDGQPHAMVDSCLHRGLSLVEGRCADGFITCPEHWWRYDLRDGSLQGTPGRALQTFPCRVVDGVVEVDVPVSARPLSLREQLLAHARSGRSEDA